MYAAFAYSFAHSLGMGGSDGMALSSVPTQSRVSTDRASLCAGVIKILSFTTSHRDGGFTDTFTRGRELSGAKWERGAMCITVKFRCAITSLTMLITWC